MLKLGTSLCAFAILAFPATGQTVTLFNSVTDTVSFSDSISELGPLGFSFSTGGSSVNLTQVQISVTNPSNCIGDLPRNSRPRFINASFINATEAISPSITIQLYSNNATGPKPGSALATIGTVLDSSVTSCTSLLTLALGTPFALSASTRYWVVVSTSTSSVLELNGENTASGSGVLGEFYYEDGATVMNDAAFIGSATGSLISAPTTPAPASILLTLAGLACVGLWLGRRGYLRRQA